MQIHWAGLVFLRSGSAYFELGVAGTHEPMEEGAFRPRTRRLVLVAAGLSRPCPPVVPCLMDSDLLMMMSLYSSL